MNKVNILLDRAIYFSLLFIFLSNDLIGCISTLRDIPIAKIEEIPHKLEAQALYSPASLEAIQETRETSETPIANDETSKIIYFLLSRTELQIGADGINSFGHVVDDQVVFTIPNGLPIKTKAYLSFKTNGNIEEQLTLRINGEQVYQPMFYKDPIKGKTSVEINSELLRPGENDILFINSKPSMTIEIEDTYVHTGNLENIVSYGHEIYRDLSEVAFYTYDTIDNASLIPLHINSKQHCPSIPLSIQNITKDASSYHMSTSIQSFTSVSIPFEAGLIQSHSDLTSLRVYYFDRASSSWLAVVPSHIDQQNAQVEAQAPSGTDYFVGLIKAPEMPEAAAFVPTAITDIKAAQPSAGMSMMQPPSINRKGDAAIQYPLEIPQGRQGLTPKVALSYSSDASTGWLGEGWNIGVAKVSVDTRWGVPSYSPSEESEVYLLNGSTLSMEGGVRANRKKAVGGSLVAAARSTRSEDYFFEASRSQYKEIIRKKDAEGGYFWIERFSDNTINYYGTRDGVTLDTSSVLMSNDRAEIAEWYITRTQDKWGNYIDYQYSKGKIEDPGKPISQARFIVLSSIVYTGKLPTTVGKHQITFHSSHDRPNPRISFKNGFKTCETHLLDSVSVTYDNQLIKRYKAVYQKNKSSNFFKTLLLRWSEFRNGQFFYAHDFDYYDHHEAPIEYGEWKTLKEWSSLGDEPAEFNEGRERAVGNQVESKLNHSPLGSGISYGWSVGGSIGTGVENIAWAPNFLKTKNAAISGHVGYSGSSSYERYSLMDVNADGIPDLVKKGKDRWSYDPITVNSAGELRRHSSKNITKIGSRKQSESHSFNYGYDAYFDLVGLKFYYGQNWSNGRSVTEGYFTDYNADGIMDYVHYIDKNSRVHFGNLSELGQLSFNHSSRTSFSPVHLNSVVEDDEEEVPLRSIEIVRTWRAPYDGFIQIQGTAEVHPHVKGVMRVAIQKNDMFISTFSDVDNTSPLSTNIASTSVSKGDLIMFRVRSGENGIDDVVRWNPSISYISTNSPLTDGNHTSFSQSSYSDGFILSAPEPFIFNPRVPLRVDWPSFTVADLSDSVCLNTFFTLVDTVNDIILAQDTVTVIIPQGAAQMTVPSGQMSGFQNTPVAPYAIDLSYASGLPTIYQEVDTTQGQLAYVSFSVYANSNVDWNKIQWRPRVELYDGTECLGTDLVTSYPHVSFQTKNKVVRTANPFQKAFSATSLYSLFPNRGSLTGWPNEAFSAEERSQDIPRVVKTAIVTVKSKKRLLERFALEFVIDKSSSTPRFSLVRKPVTVNGNVRNIDISNVSVSFNKGYFFNGDLVINDSIAIDVYTSDTLLQEFFNRTSPAMPSFFIRQYGPSLVFADSIVDFGLYGMEYSELNEHYLGWGQFAWADSTEAAIEPSALQSPYAALANDPAFTATEEGDALDTAGLIDAMNTSLDHDKIQFYPLLPLRHERNILRTFSLDRFADTISPYPLDHWSYFGGHMGAYASQGVTVPDYLDESTELDKPVNPSSPVVEEYSAFGTRIKSKSKSKATTSGIQDKMSLSVNSFDYQKYNSQTKHRFADFNGDGFPDIIRSLDNSYALRETDRFGGHQLEVSLTTLPYLQRTQVARYAMVHPGKFINKDFKREDKEPRNLVYQIIPSLSGSFGPSIGKGELMDINGDGLPDYVDINSQEHLSLKFGTGSFLTSTVEYDNYDLHDYRISYASSFGISPRLKEQHEVLNNGVTTDASSFAVGIGYNLNSQVTKRQPIDINGDGLVDILEVLDNDDLRLRINSGNGLHGSIDIDLQDAESVQKNQSHDISLNGSFPFKISIPTIFGIAFKTPAVKGEGSLSISWNNSTEGIMDMNGDGLADIVMTKEVGSTSELGYYPAKWDKLNKLKSVTNPLGGSFEISYKRVGNKRGLYKPEITTHLTSDHEVILWDMPESKLVMSGLVIRDGLDIEYNTSTSTTINDGHDQQTLKFFYDGGMKSRRERQFLGFSKIESWSPADTLYSNGSKKCADLSYIATVQEYEAVHALLPDTIINYTYVNDILKNTYTLYKRFSYLEVDAPSGGTGTICQKLNDTIILLGATMNEYKLYEISHEVDGRNKNGVALLPGTSDFQPIVAGTLPEVYSLFPALERIQTISYPQKNERQRFHVREFVLGYDSLLNVVRYDENGIQGQASIERVVAKEFVHSYIIDTSFSFGLHEIINGTAPTMPPVTIDTSIAGINWYIVPSLVEGYSDDTLAINPSSAFSRCANLDCYTISLDSLNNSSNDSILPIAPMSLDHEPSGDTTICDSLRVVYTFHKKLVHDTVRIYEDRITTPFSGRILARMQYFAPDDAQAQTSVLKDHRIYIDYIPTAYSHHNLVRHDSVSALHNSLVASELYNLLSRKHKAISNIVYDAYGNVVQFTGPENHAGQRLQVSLTYENTLHQYPTEISNSYGDQACMLYDIPTGLLLKSTDINGHSMQYVYDDFYRVSEIWAPNELSVNNGAATISFEYFPKGINIDPANPLQLVPVAITHHNINGADPNWLPIGGEVQEVEAPDCDGLYNLSQRPAAQFTLETATFTDGLGKVVQIKKETENSDVSITDQEHYGRIVSTSPFVDERWRDVLQIQNFYEAPTHPLGELTLPQTNHIQVATTDVFDYMNRVKKSSSYHHSSNGANSIESKTKQKYEWQQPPNTVGPKQFGVHTTIYSVSDTSSSIKSSEYSNEYGQSFLKVQDVGGVNAATSFNLNAIDQLLSTTNPIGVVTTYQYDRFGRTVLENHKDRGITSFRYDLANNLIRIHTPETGQDSIEMTYHFSRLTQKTYPLTGVTNNVTFHYGSMGDGKNGAGRVVQIVQGNDLLDEAFEYDALGQQVYQKRTVRIPNVGAQSYVTEHQYDSWGRVKSIIYPDETHVNYSYLKSGELNSMVSISNSIIQNIIDQTRYDGLGNISRLYYGNGTKTSFTYDASTQRLSGVHLVASDQKDMLMKTYGYDYLGNVNHVTNTAQHPLMGGTYSINYTYDGLNRLALADGDWGGQGYNLTMAYNAVGGILTKELNAPDISGFDLPNAESYGLCYAYDSHKPHQLKALHGQGVIRHFEYNDAGSVTGVYTLEGEEPEPFPFCVSATQEPGQEMPEGMGQRIYQERFVWDEEQRLMGVRNQAGIHHYLYDAQGERLMKTSLLGADVAINGEGTAGLSTLDPYLLYVNPYFVQRHYHNWKESSKHYYMGTQRIASELMGAPFDADGLPDPPQEGPGGMEKTQSGSSYPSSGTFGALSAWSSFDTLLQRLDITTDPNFWDGLQSLIPYQDYFLESQFHDLQEGCETGETQQGPNKTQTPNPPNTPNPECLCANSPFYAWEIHGIECTEYRLLYWYHPDYLGHNEFITDNSGLPYQYFHYSAFGETLVEDNAHYGQFSSPYRFNAKELDGETGNYYYGARYYNPTWSVWLSVDPLAHEFSSWTPYHFVHNNPVNLIDPKGLNAWKPGDVEGEWVAEPGDGAESLARDAGISREVAYRLMDAWGYGTYTDKDGKVKSRVNPGDRIQLSSNKPCSNTIKFNIYPEELEINKSSLNTSSTKSDGLIFTLVGAYMEGGPFSIWTGVDFGRMYIDGLGWMDYITEHKGLKTEAVSIGGSLGLILYSGNKEDLTRGHFYGQGYSVELSFSQAVIDEGINGSWSTIKDKNGHPQYILFIGPQASFGAGTPYLSGGATKTTTTLR